MPVLPSPSGFCPFPRHPRRLPRRDLGRRGRSFPGRLPAGPCGAGPMAASEDGSGCLVSRGRSQSDPSVLGDPSATSAADAAGENPGNGFEREAGRAGRTGRAGRKARAQGSPRPLRLWGSPRGTPTLQTRGSGFLCQARAPSGSSLCPGRSDFPCAMEALGMGPLARWLGVRLGYLGPLLGCC